MFADVLRAKLAGIAVLSGQQAAQLQSHYELMVRWNRSINLTTVTELDEAIERHYCESIFLAAKLPPTPLRIVDIGSGPGFPGIPVAVFRPDCSITLVESHQRKAVFLKEATRHHSNVRVVPKRAEEVEETFDCVISRAVSYADLQVSLSRLAGLAELLTGGEEPPPDWGWNWQSLQVPWGRERFVRSGFRR